MSCSSSIPIPSAYILYEKIRASAFILGLLEVAYSYGET